MSDDELYFGDFERAGEDVVRNNLAVCTENLICVGGTTESPKLTE
jgi:hypothetical protein